MACHILEQQEDVMEGERGDGRDGETEGQWEIMGNGK